MSSPSPPVDYLLDTNILVALCRNDDLGKYIDRTYQITAAVHAIYLPIVVVGEIQAFAAKKGWGAGKIAVLNQILTAFTPFLDISNPHTLASYAGLDCGSYAVGVEMGKNDLWIASVAQTYGLTLLTTDRDFDHLGAAGLISHIWIDPASK